MRFELESEDTIPRICRNFRKRTGVYIDLVLGALKQYKPIFEVSRTQTAKILLKTYQTRDDVNDTYIHWLVKVANDKNMTTLAGKLFVKYLISINDPRFVDKHGQPKIYITPKSILIQQIAFMMRRDTLLEDPLNYIIQRFIIQGGVCEKIKKQYESKIFREDYTASENEPNDEDDDQDGTDPGVHPLTPSQLQAAFTIWLMGLLVACNSIIIEIIVTYIEKWLKKKHN
ncbi:uncharacterized protein LOC126746230 isoform X2 [Anthonomus grandis grandis]|uniref:uncharacterized protein LOC126746230 isoform X2 n=1 Tax=Anthonomus grandis grandis TaxID=2921223 RepID=UPI002166585B|nr:uncharacterized protein LOC126746230 isoform X2 [Anthonomus grandis grandis]